MERNDANILRTAQYFEGPLAARFDMARWADHAHWTQTATCGSIGCLIGQSPYAGFEKPEEEGWIEYSERIFGLRWGSPEWNWCFAPWWGWSDNTPTGGAARLRYLVAHGVPENWERQMRGKAPLCY